MLYERNKSKKKYDASKIVATELLNKQRVTLFK